MRRSAGSPAVRRPVRRCARGLAAVLVMAVPVLGGCAQIPTSGPVVAGRPVALDPQEGVSGVVPNGPVPGASPVGVVNGFLRAAAGFAYGHRVARNFLTPQRRAAWRPDASVQVYERREDLSVKRGAGTDGAAVPAPTTTAPDPSPRASGSGTAAHPDVARVRVRAPLRATIDQQGRYTAAEPGDEVNTVFSLVLVDGQWRINALTDGILISAADFGLTFRAFPVYFGDPTGRYLVPDVHWFPGTRDEPNTAVLPTSLVRALLAGPPPWLAGAVVTGAPPNTQMAVGAVVVTDDEATVDLTGPVRQADSRQRRLLASQLRATLRQLRTILSVRITVQGVAFEVPAEADGATSEFDGRGPSEPLVDPQVDQRPVVIDTKGRVARLVGAEAEPVKDVAGLAVEGARSPAVAGDASAYAVLDGDRRHLLFQLPGTSEVPLVSGKDLTAPSFDPSGWVWTAPGRPKGFVWAAGIEPGAVKVDASWLQGEVVAMRVSRDGARVAITTRHKERAHVYVSGILRDVAGRPQALTQPPGELIPALRTVKDLAWVDEDEIAVLGSTAGASQTRPLVVQIGGGTRLGTPLPGARSLTAGSGELTMLLGTSKGVYARSGALWSKVSNALWPAFPG